MGLVLAAIPRLQATCRTALDPRLREDDTLLTRRHPRFLGHHLRLKRADCLGFLKRQTDIIEPIHQTMFAERIDTANEKA